jgi:hypothetical protein
VFRPRVTLRDVEAALRQVTRDPVLAEQRVGHLYGHVFRNKETIYDAQGGRWTARERDHGEA